MSNDVTKFRVVEIFDSIDGEGLRMGQPVSFIRLAGCNLRCTYCDTPYSLFGEDVPCEYTEMTAEEILSAMNKNYRRVTLTGGEPLISPGVNELVDLLSDNGFEVNIETNGAADIVKFLSAIKSRDNLFFTIDYKLPSSGMEDKMLYSNFTALLECDVIKYVVGSDEDAKTMVEFTKKLKTDLKVMPHIFAGAVYGEFELEKLTGIILEEPVMKDARIQVQLHKIIWDPDKKGV